MKLRIKFEKTGPLSLIGHLDVMRYFQKLNRRAGLDVCYTEGFSPHQKMAFGSPLSLGVQSHAEYADIEMNSIPGKEELIERMNRVNVPELRVVDACILPDGAKNAMALIAASAYSVRLREGYQPENVDGTFDDMVQFFAAPSIMITKETKKTTSSFDLVKEIRALEKRGDALYMTLTSTPSRTVKPEILFETYFNSKGETFDPLSVVITREELFGETEDGTLQPLIAYGERSF